MSKLSTVEFNKLFNNVKKELKKNKPDKYWNQLYDYIRPYITFIARGSENVKMDVTIEDQLVALVPSIIKKYNSKKTESAHSYLTYALRNKKNTILSNWYNRLAYKVIQQTVSCYEGEENTFNNLEDNRVNHVTKLEQDERLDSIKTLLKAKKEGFIKSYINDKINVKDLNIILDEYILGNDKPLLGYKLHQIERVITAFRKHIKESKSEFKNVMEV